MSLPGFSQKWCTWQHPFYHASPHKACQGFRAMYLASLLWGPYPSHSIFLSFVSKEDAVTTSAFSVVAPEFWNALSLEVHTVLDLIFFLHRVQNHLLSQAFKWGMLFQLVSEHIFPFVLYFDYWGGGVLFMQNSHPWDGHRVLAGIGPSMSLSPRTREPQDQGSLYADWMCI